MQNFVLYCSATYFNGILAYGNLFWAENFYSSNDLESPTNQTSRTFMERYLPTAEEVSVPCGSVTYRFSSTCHDLYFPLNSMSCFGVECVDPKRFTGCNQLFCTELWGVLSEQYTLHNLSGTNVGKSATLSFLCRTGVRSLSFSVAMWMSYKKVLLLVLHLCRRICCLKRD